MERNDRGRTVRRVLVEIRTIPLLAVAVLWAVQDRLVFLPAPDLPPIATVAPTGEDVTYPTADGTTGHAWFLPAQEPHDDRPVTVIVFHGNAGNRAGMAAFGRRLAEAGMHVLLPEYRGYADAAGAPSEDGLRLDADAALAYALSRPEVDPDRIVYVGHSLGTGVAAALAEEHPPRALVLLAPFTSLPAVAWSRLPGLPYDLLMRSQLRTDERIGHLAVPLLIVGGTADSTVPAEHSRRLFDLAPAPKRLVMIDGADHDLVAPDHRGPSPSGETVAWIRANVPDGPG